MGGWNAIWGRLSPLERRVACTAYLESAADNPGALDSAVDWLARACHSRPQKVRRWSAERRAERLALAPGLPPLFVAAIMSAYLVRHHEAPLVRFLDVVGVPHRAGVLNLAHALEPAPLERLVVGLRAIEGGFDARIIDLYLDACEAQGVPLWRDLAEARRGAAP